MRIIAGIAKGRKIIPPDGMQTRPTLDRVKENIFNIIQTKISNCTAIDVFAGTGSLGLEAVSRGARECYLIDMHPTTFKNLKENVKNLKFEDKCVCLNMDSYAALKDLANKKKVFDLIFIDPPYSKNMIPPAIEIIHEGSLLNKDGIIVTKIDYLEKIYDGYKNIKLVDFRKYGHTIVCFYKHKEE